MAFEIRLAGKKDVLMAHFKDKLRGLKEQSEESWPALEVAVSALIEHMPQKSPIHGGVLIQVSGDVRPETGKITITVESIAMLGG
jgi:hypothetical protein